MRPFTIRPSAFARPSSRTLALLLSLLIGVATMTGRAVLAANLEERLTGDAKLPWQISADTVDYDATTTTYYARGNVVIEKQKTRLVADQVAFNRQAMTASATGHVLMTVGEDVLTGDRLDIDLNRETGVLNDGGVFFKDSHFYIRGQRIEKTGKDTYQAERGSLTTCDGDRPAWVITGRKVNVTVEGYGSAQHAIFKARDMPVLYSPYLIFPVKTKRQSGLLLPEIGYSDRKGFYWDQPFFWAINDSSDATVYVNPMKDRGTKVGLEYRYALSDRSYGAIMADGLKDRRTDNGTEADEKWGYDGDAYTRPNTDRYWLRAKVDQELPAGAMARLDLDIVSDQDYLVEFRDGRSGFYATRDYFLDAFGRDIDTYDEIERTNQANINKIWDHFSFNSDVLWNDNVIKRRWRDTDDTLQQLPRLQFNGTKQQILDSDVYWDMDSEYVYFYREDGDRGHRTDIHPRTYLPMRWGNYLAIEPSAGIRQTTWVMDRWSDDDLTKTSTREIYDLELDLSTELAKVMNSPLANIDRIRHSIKPKVVYAYIPGQDQSDLPYFTTTDRIAEANQITYSLTNTFTARTTRKAPAMPETQDSGVLDPERLSAVQRPRSASRAASSAPPEWVDTFNYQRFSRIYLEQTYHIAESEEDDGNPFSDLYGELDFHLGRFLTVSADAEYDVYELRFSSHNVGVSIGDTRGDRLRVEHRYTTSVNESIRSSASLVLTDNLTLRGVFERNMLTNKNLVQGIGFLYRAQCWSLDFLLANEEGDLSVSVLVNLQGIGGIGQ